MRISRLTDYGILVLAQCAKAGNDQVHNARDLAAACELPLPTVSKVLKVLTRAGLLVSHRGVAGGYALARDPADVTLFEVISAFEGPIAMTTCAEGPGSCSLEHSCPSKPHLQFINNAIRGAMESVHLSDLTAAAVSPKFMTIGSAGKQTVIAHIGKGASQ